VLHTGNAFIYLALPKSVPANKECKTKHRDTETQRIMIHLFSAGSVYYVKELTGRIIDRFFNVCH